MKDYLYSVHMNSIVKESSFHTLKTFERFPRMRYMGNKYKLLPWLTDVFMSLDFEKVLDPFSGSGSVSYLLKCLNKQVFSSDFLNFPVVISKAMIANQGVELSSNQVKKVINKRKAISNFALMNYENIFYTPEDLKFIDLFWSVAPTFKNEFEQNIAIAALIRSCAKRQPRGIFTVAGDPEHYKDGRRDLALSLRQHFIEQVEAINNAVFSSSKVCSAARQDVFSVKDTTFDLVYLDPPYIPKANDNCYMKRYHFLEGVSCYWKGQELLETSKVKKIKKPYTAFSYKSTAFQTFDKLFEKFQASKIVLSYSSNSVPSIEILYELMKRYKKKVDIIEKDYRYHIGNHKNAKINDAKEYLLIGQ